ncbi:hypothetical protein HY500_04205 [Candidatus Woesearchaeota archaeon]|nr:hypothetical protein [Candidatus Woesearchaeota archaeon]
MKLEQHFMINEELCKRIVSYLEIQLNEVVLEIGPGRGALTKYLIKETKKVVVIEISFDLTSELITNFKGIKVINDSITSFKELNFDRIIGNIPYSVCEPLMSILVSSKFKTAVFTVPANFMKKGLLNLIMQKFFTIEILEEINKNAFDPKPKVKSKVIRIRHKEMSEKEKIIKEIYLQSDKKFDNAFREAYCKVLKLTKKEAKSKLPELSFLNKKVYTLSLEEWKEVIEEIEKEFKN